MRFIRIWILGTVICGEYLPFEIIQHFFGEKGKDWSLYECDRMWWELRLFTRIN